MRFPKRLISPTDSCTKKKPVFHFPLIYEEVKSRESRAKKRRRRNKPWNMKNKDIWSYSRGKKQTVCEGENRERRRKARALGVILVGLGSPGKSEASSSRSTRTMASYEWSNSKLSFFFLFSNKVLCFYSSCPSISLSLHAQRCRPFNKRPWFHSVSFFAFPLEIAGLRRHLSPRFLFPLPQWQLLAADKQNTESGNGRWVRECIGKRSSGRWGLRDLWDYVWIHHLWISSLRSAWLRVWVHLTVGKGRSKGYLSHAELGTVLLVWDVWQN